MHTYSLKKPAWFKRAFNVLSVIAAITMVFNMSALGVLITPQTAQASTTNLSTDIMSWNILGVDSNSPKTAGPHEFLVQVRVTNTGATDASNVFTNFSWGTGTADDYLSLLSSANQPLNTITAATYKDVFYVVKVTPKQSGSDSDDNPSNAVFDTTRPFTVSTTSPDASTTSDGQSLYIEHILSQSRNHILSSTVTPSNPLVGQPFTVHVEYETSTVYPYITPQMTYNPAVATLDSVETNYVTDGATEDDIFGTDHGNIVHSDFHFRANTDGNLNFYYTVLDNSGSSYHYNADSSNAIIVPVEPRQNLEKSVDKSIALPGDTLTYTLNYFNTGNIDLQNVVITETYDGHFTFNSSTPSPSSGNNVWNIGTLPVATGGSIVITGTLNESFPNGTTKVHNKAKMSTTTPNVADLYATADTTVTTACKLVVTKSVDKTTAQPGDTLTYTLNYKNDGTADCTGGGVHVTDVIPVGSEYISHTPTVNSTYDGTKVMWNLGTVAPKTSGELELKVKVLDREECGNWTIDNAATFWAIDAASRDQMTGSSNTATTNVSKPCGGKILVQKQIDTDGDGQVDIDGTNPNAALAGWNFDVNGTPTNPAPKNTTNTGSLEFQVENGTYSVTEAVKNSHVLQSAICKKDGQTVGTVNLANGTVSGLQISTDEIISCTFVNHPQTCQLKIDKYIKVGNDLLLSSDAKPGDTVTYVLKYRNDGNADCTGGGVKIYDPLDSQVTYVNSSRSIQISNDTEGDSFYPNQGNDYNGTSKTKLYNVRRVSPGESGEITFQATVNDWDGCGKKQIPNKAKIWSDQTGDLWSNYVYTDIVKPCEGKLKVNKKVDTDGNGTFESGNSRANTIGFRWRLDNESPDRNMGTQTTTTAGSHTVTEKNVLGLGYHPTGWYVNGSDYTCETTTYDTLPANIDVTTDGLEITLCNARDIGDLGGTKFNDVNENGIFDAGEPTIEGVIINLSNGQTRTTDENGNYLFKNLPTGLYDVEEIVPINWLNTTNNPVVNAEVFANQTTYVDFGNAEKVTLDLDKWNNQEVAHGGDGIAETNETINYQIDWSVAGNSIAQNVVLVDHIPSELNIDTNSITSSDGTTVGVWDATARTITWDFGTQQPNASGFVNYSATVTVPIANGTVIHNVAKISADNSDPQYLEDDSDVTVESLPIMTIEKTVDIHNDLGFVNPGDTVTYTVVVSNTGTGTLHKAKLSDTLPTGFLFADTLTPTKVFDLGDIATGDSVTTTYDVIVGANVKAGFYDNLAVATADNSTPKQDTATVEVRVPTPKGETTPKLTIDKTVNVQFANPGDTIAYTIVLKNVGDGDALDVTTTDTLPTGFTFEDGKSTHIWDVGTLGVDKSWTMTYNVKVGKDVAAGQYENLAIARSSNTNPVQDRAQVEVRIPKVLGESVPNTGVGFKDLAIFIASLLMIIAGALFIHEGRKRVGPAQDNA